jgi:hypothetical protein
VTRKEEIKNAIIAIFGKYSAGHRLRFNQIRTEIEEIFKKQNVDFELHPQTLHRVIEEMEMDGTLKKDLRYHGYQFAPIRRQNDPEKITLYLKMKNDFIFGVISSSNDEEILSRCVEYEMDLRELQKKMHCMYDYADNESERLDVQKILDLIKSNIQKMYQELENKDSKLRESLQQQVLNLINEEYIQGPYSCVISIGSGPSVPQTLVGIRPCPHGHYDGCSICNDSYS